MGNFRGVLVLVAAPNRMQIVFSSSVIVRSDCEHCSLRSCNQLHYEFRIAVAITAVNTGCCEIQRETSECARNPVTAFIVACLQIVFSSSATVYGQPDHVPCTEESKLETLNPYGRTKVRYITDEGLSCGRTSTSLGAWLVGTMNR